MFQTISQFVSPGRAESNGTECLSAFRTHHGSVTGTNTRPVPSDLGTLFPPAHCNSDKDNQKVTRLPYLFLT